LGKFLGRTFCDGIRGNCHDLRIILPRSGEEKKTQNGPKNIQGLTWQGSGSTEVKPGREKEGGGGDRNWGLFLLAL